MKRRLDLLFAAILVPLDFLAMVLAGWTAYSLRFHEIAGLLPVAQTIPIRQFFLLALPVAVVWTIVLALAGVYRLRQQLSSELGRIFLGVSTGVLLVIVTIFFQREFFASRFIILATWVLAILYVWLIHLLTRGIQRLQYRRGVGARQVVMIGHDQTTGELIRLFRSRPSLGYHIVQSWPEVNLTMLDEARQLLQSGTVDELLQGDPSIPKAQTLQLLELCIEHNVTFKYAADLFDTQAGNVEVHDLAGVPLIEIKRTPLDGWGRIFKRTMDMLVGWLMAVMLFLPGVIVALAIKLDSAGPVFVRLERVGQGQRKFKLWKFRSMIVGAHALKSQLLATNERADGPLFKMKHDPRITRVGRFIRKTSLDEIPQLFNVLRGDMSLVGPRPHEPEEVARYEKHHKKLLTIKPGMTGMAQVSGRSNLSFEDEVRLDTYYIEHWSLGLDWQILFRTPTAVFRTDSAA